MVLPPPTSQTVFILTLVFGSSVPFQTPRYSEYRPFVQSPLQTPRYSEYRPFVPSPVVSALSRTKLQQHGTTSLLLSVTHLPSLLTNFPQKPFSSKLFLRSHCHEVPVCVGLWVCVCVSVCARACACLLFAYLNCSLLNR